MDLNNPVIRLCAEGARAEFEGRAGDACTLYLQAWQAARDDYEACLAAHYMARCQKTPEDTLAWNLEALRLAHAVGDERVSAWYASLYANLARSHELLGDMDAARRYYGLAADLGLEHQVE